MWFKKEERPIAQLKNYLVQLPTDRPFTLIIGEDVICYIRRIVHDYTGDYDLVYNQNKISVNNVVFDVAVDKRNTCKEKRGKLISRIQPIPTEKYKIFGLGFSPMYTLYAPPFDLKLPLDALNCKDVITHNEDERRERIRILREKVEEKRYRERLAWEAEKNSLAYTYRTREKIVNKCPEYSWMFADTHRSDLTDCNVKEQTKMYQALSNAEHFLDGRFSWAVVAPTFVAVKLGMLRQGSQVMINGINYELVKNDFLKVKESSYSDMYLTTLAFVATHFKGAKLMDLTKSRTLTDDIDEFSMIVGNTVIKSSEMIHILKDVKV
jgi:hypothetical protein